MNKKVIFAWVFLCQTIFLVILNAFCTNASIPDYEYYILHTECFQWNPYTNIDNEFYWKYPGFYYIYMGILGLFGIHSEIGIRFMIGLFDIINTFLITRIVLLIQRKYSKPQDDAINPWIFACVYFYFPHHLVTLNNGENDLIALTFLLYAVKLFLEKKEMKSAISLGFGIMFKIYPIFLLIPIGVFLIKSHKLPDLIKYFLVIGAVFLLTSLPYIILDASAYIHGIFLHASRASTGFTYNQFLHQFYEIAFVIFGISVSYLFIGQILILTLLVFFLYRRKEPLQESDIISGLLYSLIIITIVIFSDTVSTIPRYLPFLILIVYFQVKHDNNRLFWGIWILFASTVFVFTVNFNIEPFSITNRLIFFTLTSISVSFFCFSWRFIVDKLILMICLALVMIIKSLLEVSELQTNQIIMGLIFLRIFLYGSMLYLLIKSPKFESVINNSTPKFTKEYFLVSWKNALDYGVKIALLERINQISDLKLKEVILAELSKIETDPQLQGLIQQNKS